MVAIAALLGTSVAAAAKALPFIKLGLPLLAAKVPEISTVAGSVLAGKVPPMLGKAIATGAHIAGTAVNQFGVGSDKTKGVVNKVVEAIKPAADVIAAHTDKAPPDMPDLSPEAAAKIDAALEFAENMRRAASADLDAALNAAEGKSTA